ncbi:NAD(P)H-dependent glycerol-3-phosphate dehydrogenase [Hoeflea sp. CAU 1731]
MTASLAVIGAGAFGTALACVVARRGAGVTLLGRDAKKIAAIANTRNHPSLPDDAEIPVNVQPTADPAHLAGAGLVLLAVPSQSLRSALQTYAPHLAPNADLVVCAKGLEADTGLLLSDVTKEETTGHAIAVLSGPAFAADIVHRLPTALTLACDNPQKAEYIAESLSGQAFRLYSSTDLAGVQIGGALKNVLAIACGIVEGYGLGESARAALIARGLAELGRFAAAHGGKAETVAGLSGLGDLVLTATSHQSRNMRFGLAIGRGEDPAVLLAPGKPLAEGAHTANIAAGVAARKNIVMPITAAVAAILRSELDVGKAIEALMTRPLTFETE